MKYIDGFRAPAPARALVRSLRDLARGLGGRRVQAMEVCGSHTMAIARHGIRDILPPEVDMVSGPGCPVCVTPPGYIDAAVELASRGVIIATFGDMLNVPGSDTTLSAARAAGATIDVCYTPSSAVSLAAQHPRREVVFLAVGFETTMGPVVSIVERALREHVSNVSLLTAFKRVPPALAALRADPDLRIDAFLCPAHVSAIIGPEPYEPFAGPGGIPCVIAGFEPLDILLGLEEIIRQLVAGEARVVNQYSRVVRAGGNRRAQALMARYLEPAQADWRGVGVIPDSGMTLRSEFAMFDAERKLGVRVGRGRTNPECRCGDVIKGKSKPPACPMFGLACTPDNALGPCMVSSEGTCAAYYKYSRLSAPTAGNGAP
jgi:hydrogenase expression/formation protein HypD